MTSDGIDRVSKPVQPVQPHVPVREESGRDAIRDGDTSQLDSVRDWLERFVTVIDNDDLDLLTLWAAHTHVVIETYTTPRLLIDSPVPGSGKTTVLDHLQRLCMDPVQAAALSSAAMLARLLDDRMRTILIDEADRTLRKESDISADLLAILNSGYRRGGTRPVLVPGKGNNWEVKEMPTYAPVVLAGNNPALPDDTRSRCIRVLLMPDIDGTAEESDWESIDDDARALGESLAHWAGRIREHVKLRPELPDAVKGRFREKWGPLKRIAVAAGGRWPETVDRLAVADVEMLNAEKEEGLTQQQPHIALLGHIHAVWQPGAGFMATANIIDALVNAHPESWGGSSPFGKRLTAQRLGRMLSQQYRVMSNRIDATGPRGYTWASLATAFRRFGYDPVNKPPQTAELAEPAVTEPMCTVCRQRPLRVKAGRGMCAECQRFHAA